MHQLNGVFINHLMRMNPTPPKSKFLLKPLYSDATETNVKMKVKTVFHLQHLVAIKCCDWKNQLK